MSNRDAGKAQCAPESDMSGLSDLSEWTQELNCQHVSERVGCMQRASKSGQKRPEAPDNRRKIQKLNAEIVQNATTAANQSMRQDHDIEHDAHHEQGKVQGAAGANKQKK
jgi:hypothetical protein